MSTECLRMRMSSFQVAPELRDTPDLDQLRRRLIPFARVALYDPSQAEDAVQSALIMLLRYMEDEDGITHPYYLARTIVRNQCIDMNRKRRRSRVAASIDAPDARTGCPKEYPSLSPTVDSVVVRDQIIRIVKETVGKLDPRTRTVLQGLYWEGKSQQEMAASLSISARTVYNIRQRALTLLKKRLRQAGICTLPAPLG